MATAKGYEADSKGGGNTAPSSNILPDMLVQLRYAAVVRSLRYSDAAGVYNRRLVRPADSSGIRAKLRAEDGS